MQYKPTLGGLKKAQEFFNVKGFPMPIFEMYVDATFEEGKITSTKGRVISIDEAIKEHGAICEVTDVRLVNVRGDKFINFVGLRPPLCDPFTAYTSAYNGWGVLIRFCKDPAFGKFMNSKDGKKAMDLARWGKRPNILDRIKFRFLPNQYFGNV